MSLEPSRRADDDREFSFDLADVAETRWDSVLGLIHIVTSKSCSTRFINLCHMRNLISGQRVVDNDHQPL